MRGGEQTATAEDYDSYVEYLFSTCASFFGCGTVARRSKTDPRRRVLVNSAKECAGCGKRNKALKQFSFADQSEGVAFCNIDHWGLYRANQ